MSFLILIVLLASAGQLVNAVEVKKGMSRCKLEAVEKQFFIPIRGTGYYWGEYLVSNKFHEGMQLLLLIKSSLPVFVDREGMLFEENTCDKQTIVDYLWLTPPSGKFYIDSFDCHITDDMPIPIAEATVGFVDKVHMGLQKATLSWSIKVKPFGKGGEIKAVDSSRNVLCTMLPSIDHQ